MLQHVNICHCECNDSLLRQSQPAVQKTSAANITFTTLMITNRRDMPVYGLSCT